MWKSEGPAPPQKQGTLRVPVEEVAFYAKLV
jgi:hypothetical protein